jgi:hypothetical protein
MLNLNYSILRSGVKMTKTRRNDPCPCGSGKKYKNCCYLKHYSQVEPSKIDAEFTLDNGSKVKQPITSLDSIPTHNKNGLQPEITSEQMMDLCLDEIHKLLLEEEVGMLHDLADAVIKEMDIIPTFTYRQLVNHMTKDGRFEIAYSQTCSLKGTDPIQLLTRKVSQMEE